MWRYVILTIVMIFSSGQLTWAEGLSMGNVPLKADGPYILYGENGSARVLSVTAEGVLRDTVFTNGLPDGYSFTVTDQSGRYEFDVSVGRLSVNECEYNRASRIFVLSDPHGRLDLMVELLKSHHIIDDELHWSYGRGHLVVLGDVFDRGDDVTQILWLLYRLDQEAVNAGGRMSFILGNHETMVVAGDFRYVEDKYHCISEKIGLSLSELYGKNTELGKWLGSRNAIELAGDYLFVHAGISPDLLSEDMSISEINDAMRNGLFLDRNQRKADPLIRMLFSNPGPVWYRGWMRDEEKYSPATEEQVSAVLQRYGAGCMIVGHTMLEDVTVRYSGNVIGINVDNIRNSRNSLGRAILIKGRKVHLVGNDRLIKRLK